MSRFPDIRVAFAVFDRVTGQSVHTGSYRLADDTERRAFGERCHQAIADGYLIQTWCADVRERA